MKYWALQWRHDDDSLVDDGSRVRVYSSRAAARLSRQGLSDPNKARIIQIEVRRVE